MLEKYSSALVVCSSRIAPPHCRIQESLVKEYNKFFWNPQLPVHAEIPTAGMQILNSKTPPLVLGEQLHRQNFSLINKVRELWSTPNPASVAYTINPTEPMTEMELSGHKWKVLNRSRTSGICRGFLHGYLYLSFIYIYMFLSAIYFCPCSQHSINKCKL